MDFTNLKKYLKNTNAQAGYDWLTKEEPQTVPVNLDVMKQPELPEDAPDEHYMDRKLGNALSAITGIGVTSKNKPGDDSIEQGENPVEGLMLGATMGGGKLAAKGLKKAAPFAERLLADEIGGVPNVSSKSLLEELEALRKTNAELKGHITPEGEWKFQGIDTPSTKSPENAAFEKEFDPGWYHGTKADIHSFDPATRGASTEAGSAKQGYFFARDPSTAADYAEMSPDRAKLRLTSLQKQLESLENKYGGLTDFKAKATPEELAKHEKLLPEYKALEANVDKRYSPESIEESLKAQEYAYQAHTAHSKNSRKALIDKLSDHEQQMYEYKDTLDYMKDMPANHPGLAEDRAKYQELYNKSKQQVDDLKQKLHNFNDKEWEAQNKSIIDEIKRAQRNSQNEGANVLPAKLRMKNPLIHDYKGEAYREESYASIMKKAKELGHDGVIFKNTYDPADPNNRKLQDIAAVFEPNQIRSKFAAFDPSKKDSGDIAAGLGAVALGAKGVDEAQASEAPDAKYKALRSLLKKK